MSDNLGSPIAINLEEDEGYSAEAGEGFADLLAVMLQLYSETIVYWGSLHEGINVLLIENLIKNFARGHGRQPVTDGLRRNVASLLRAHGGSAPHSRNITPNEFDLGPVLRRVQLRWDSIKPPVKKEDRAGARSRRRRQPPGNEQSELSGESSTPAIPANTEGLRSHEPSGSTAGTTSATAVESSGPRVASRPSRDVSSATRHGYLSKLRQPAGSTNTSQTAAAETATAPQKDAPLAPAVPAAPAVPVAPATPAAPSTSSAPVATAAPSATPQPAVQDPTVAPEPQDKKKEENPPERPENSTTRSARRKRLQPRPQNTA